MGAVGLVAFAPNLAGCGDDNGGVTEPPGGTVPDPGELPDPPSGEIVIRPYSAFMHGVASGDPLTDAVVIWTRVSPREEYDNGGTFAGPTDAGPIEVEWEMSTNADFTEIVAGDIFVTDADRDYTVKVDVTGLDAGRVYYYRFSALDEVSPTGRTTTAPSGNVDNLRFAVASCTSGAHGYFNAYRVMVDRNDIDAVLFLGDYIYEYGDGEYGSARKYDPPHEIVTLEDYRRRHAWYKYDEDLQRVHQQYPFICVWDDHEIADNSWSGGAKNHDEGEGDFFERRDGSHRAYSEWMPIRDQEDLSKIFRSFRYGNLVDLIMLDTRTWGRDEQGGAQSDDRTLLGADQEAWLHEQLEQSTAKWKVLGQQVMVAPLSMSKGSPPALNNDQWDGYTHARTRLYDEIEASGNVVVLTGDIHTAWANDLARDPFDSTRYNPATGEGSIGVEFVCTSITSPGLEALASLPKIVDVIKENSPHMKHVDVVKKGFTVLDITPSRVQADFITIDQIRVPIDPVVEIAASMVVNDGAPFLVHVTTELPARAGRPPLVP